MKTLTWFYTNIRQRHLKTDTGRIVGKLMRYWSDTSSNAANKRLTVWDCFDYPKGKPRCFAVRADEDAAKSLVASRARRNLA